MDTNIKTRYNKLGPKIAEALKSRQFDAYYFNERESAIEKVISLIPKEHQVSWGGSMTLVDLGIPEKLAKEGYNLLDRDKTSGGDARTGEDRAETMRRILLCDTFLTSTNALSEDGQLVNIDGYGNRVAAMIFGPRQVIVVAGMNKAVKTLEDAVSRARNIAAPINIQRFPNLKPPCSVTGSCADCKNADTICSFFVTTRFCKPAGRIKVVLVGEDLGF